MDVRNTYDSRKAKVMLTVSRIVVYAILIFLSILCLFAFWMLFVNASRSHSDLQGGFQLLPDTYLLTNLVNAWNHSLTEILGGMGFSSVDQLKGNREALRGLGLQETELRIMGVKNGGE